MEELRDQADVAVSKSAPPRAMASIARIEIRAGRYLHASWNAKAKSAATGARRLIAAGASLSEARSLVDATMESWKREVATVHGRHLFSAYRYAHHAATRRAKGSKKPLVYQVKKADAFDHDNENALGALKKMELLWIGETYKGVAGAIKKALEDGALLGLDRSLRGALVEKIINDKLGKIELPGGWRGDAKSYFRGLAANAITNARVQAQIDSFSRLKVKRYEIVNPMDERTSDICALLNGTVFEVSDAVDLLDKLRKASTPEEYKELHPWLGINVLKDLKSQGADALAEAGVMFPPFHFFCRSTIDISFDSMTSKAA